MTLADILLIKYPEADFFRDVIIQDDGEGPYIKEWNVINTITPTQEELTAWLNDVELQQQYTYAQNKKANIEIYTQLQTIDLKSIRAIRENNNTRIQELNDQADVLRAQLLPTA